MNTHHNSIIFEECEMEQSIAIQKNKVEIPKIIEDCSQIPDFLQIRSGLMVSEQVRFAQMQEINPGLPRLSLIQQTILPLSQIQQTITQRTQNTVTETSAIIESGLQEITLNPLIDGYILKKTKKVSDQYKKMFCRFQNGIFSIFELQQLKKAKIIINLNLFNFQYYKKGVNNSQINEFGLKCVNHNKVFSFKGENDNKWYIIITQYIEQLRKKPVAKYFINPFENYYKKRLISNNQFIEMCQSGDIILFQTNAYSAKLQRMITRSNYDHIGMVLKYASGNIFILEATQTSGVGIFDWNSMIDQQWYELYSMVVYRQLQTNRNSTFISGLEQFFKDNLGKQYKLSVSKLLTDKSTIQTEPTYFCSQLIAKVYKQLGILKTELSANQFWPGNFSNEKQDINLENSTLSDEYLIGFNM